MGMGSLTWACLLLAVDAGEPDVVYMNQRSFKIPISMSAQARAQTRDLTLWVSENEGTDWNDVKKAGPNDTHFPFEAQHDGPFWFIVTVNNGRDLQAPRVHTLPVGQKLIVDTTRPQIDLTAQRQGDEVVARWTAQDKYLDPSSLRLEYRALAGADDHWLPVRVTEPDRATFIPAIPGTVVVRLQAKDRAGNVGVSAPVEVAGPVGAGGAVPVSAQSVERVPPWSVAPPPSAPAPGSNSAPPARPEESNIPLARPGPPPVDPPPATPAPAQPVAASPAGQSEPAPQRGSVPPVRIVNKPTVNLQFEVAKVGPSGLGNVDVYITANEGATWQMFQPSVPPTFPLAAEPRPLTPVTGSVPVQLPHEGAIYGFALVVKSKAGLGNPPPLPGDPPQIRLEWDKTPPVIELYKPQPDPNGRESLILSWKATDRNLAPNPITLEWSADGQGDWHVIGEPEMSNANSHYAWRVPDNIPCRVYFRLTARDTAGNVGVAQTKTAHLVDLTVPQFTVVGVSTGR